MDRSVFQQFKSLLLGLPGWNRAGARTAFLQDVFWGHALLDRLDHEAPGDRAATELIELLAGLEASDVDGLTPACALLNAIRARFGAGPQREAALASLEQQLCRPVARIRSVLCCAANPDDRDRIRTDRELREIRDALSGRSAQAPEILLHFPRLAARARDLSQALHDTQPDVLHFSGHGAGEDGICLEDEQGRSQPVPGDALASLLGQFRHCLKVVVLNACFTEPQAQAIAGQIGHVIGTRQAIGDDAAIAFSVGFYRALAAGRSVQDAFALGCAEIRVQGIAGHLVPVLLTGPPPI